MSNKKYEILDSDIERFIERQIVITLRTMFTLDERFDYNTQDKSSDFNISCDYPYREIPNGETSIIVTGTTYTFNLQSSLGQNIAEDVFMQNTDGLSVLAGQKYRCLIPFNLTVLCQGEENFIKTLSNQVVNILAFTGKKIVEKLGLTIYNINKGSCQPKSQTPSKIFQVPISISGGVTWCGTYRCMDVNKMDDILSKITIQLKLEEEQFAARDMTEPGTYVKN